MIWLWIGFIAIISILLALDLGVFNKPVRVIDAKEALAWTSLWVTLAMLFGVSVYFLYEKQVFGIGILGVGVLASLVSYRDAQKQRTLEDAGQEGSRG